MKENLKNLYNDIDEFFSLPQSSSQKAWGLIHDLYHQILLFMEENDISKADLAKRLGKSRAAISQMFNKTPNITILRMVEIADAIGVDVKIKTSYVKEERTLHGEQDIDFGYTKSTQKRQYIPQSFIKSATELTDARSRISEGKEKHERADEENSKDDKETDTWPEKFNCHENSK